MNKALYNKDWKDARLTKSNNKKLNTDSTKIAFGESSLSMKTQKQKLTAALTQTLQNQNLTTNVAAKKIKKNPKKNILEIEEGLNRSISSESSYYESAFDLEKDDSEDELHNYALLIQDQANLYFGSDDEDGLSSDDFTSDDASSRQLECNRKGRESRNIIYDSLDSVSHEDDQQSCMGRGRIKVFLKNGIKNKFRNF